MMELLLRDGDVSRPWFWVMKASDRYLVFLCIVRVQGVASSPVLASTAEYLPWKVILSYHRRVGQREREATIET